VLRQRERVAPGLGIVLPTCRDARRAGLGIPALEGVEPRRQFAAGVGVGNGLREVVAGDGLAIEALEYSAMPRVKPSRPTSVCIMRTTSAPFSYTVGV